MDRFLPGMPIAVRGHTMGRIRTAKAVIVVEDSPDNLTYWWPAGTHHVVTTAMLTPRKNMLAHTLAELRAGHWELTRSEWIDTDVLASTKPGSWAVIWHMWRHSTGEFLCWYVDLKRPHARTPVGFDTYDLDLDIVVQPDGRWSWKDRDEFDARRAAGFIADHEADAVEKAAGMLIERIEQRRPPFDGSLIGWQPDRDWQPPGLPDDWEHTPLA